MNPKELLSGAPYYPFGSQMKGGTLICCGTASNGDESESTLPETNSFAPENGWLEDDSFPFGAKGPISGGFHLLLVYVSFRECNFSSFL